MGAESPKRPAYWGKDLNGAAPDPDQTKPDLGDEISDVAGKIWNAPNTILGLGYGGLGYIAGWPSKWLGLQKDAPGITTGNNAIQFTDNPLGGVGAITIGNTETFTPDTAEYPNVRQKMGSHEEQHTYQGQQLGPLYLPSNILGGAAGLLIDGYWHGKHNWNEVAQAKLRRGRGADEEFVKTSVLFLALLIGSCALFGCSYLVSTTFFNNTGGALQVDWEGTKAMAPPNQFATIGHANGNHMVRLIGGGCEYQYEVPEGFDDYKPDRKLGRGVQIQVEKDFSIELLPPSYAGDGPAPGDVILKHAGFPLRPVARTCQPQG